MNGLDPRIMQAVMQDPELLTLISKPEVMQKFQDIMANPQNIQAYANDPDIQTLIAKLSRLGIGGPQNAQPSFAAPAAAPSAAEHGIMKITSSGQFDRALSTAGNKLVVADFTATWCGPCKQINPFVHALADRHVGTAYILLVDGDMNRDLVMRYGVKGFPTFIFFRKGAELERFSGANRNKLEQLFYQYFEAEEEQKEASSPYKSFPLSSEEVVKYDEVKFDIVEEKIVEFNDQVDEAVRLDDVELGLAVEIIEILADKNYYHQNSLSEEHHAVLDKFLSWGASHIPPALSIFRMAVFHPECSKHFAEDGTIHRLLDLLQEEREPSKIVYLLVLQTIVNMSTRYDFREVIVATCESILEALEPCRESKNKKMRQTFANFLINLGIILIVHNGDANMVSEAKINCLPTVSSILATDKDKGVIYRTLVTLGTLIYRDEETKSIAATMELEDTVSNVLNKPKLAKDGKIVACVEELQRSFNSDDN